MCDKDGKCDLTNLSEYDKKINELKLNDMYYGTSFVCVVYGIIAVSILMASFISPTMKDIFFDQFLVFTIVFIVGSIIIISVLIYYINYYEVKKVKHINFYDTYSCPDYWNMVTLDDNNVYKNFDNNISPNYFKYKCVLNNDIFDKYDIYKTSNTYDNFNYNLTNNQLNTKNKGSIIGDYYYDNKDSKIKTNINDKNIGHLYKNINDSTLFPLNSLDNNTYAYNNQGVKLTSNYLSNIRTAIIGTSLIMNNYQYDKNNKAFSNINYNSYSDKIDPYITWNYKGTDQTNRNTIYNTNVSGASEKYYIYDWSGYDNSLTYDIYKSYFLESKKTTTNTDIKKRGVFIADKAKTIIVKAGDLYLENDKIYFKSIHNTVDNKKLFKLITADTGGNIIVNSVINTDPDKQITYDTTTPNSDIYDTFKIGPTIIINTTAGRPEFIDKSSVVSGSNIPVVCDTIYPAYLASVEDTNIFGADNAIRCSYAKLCGYSWSDMGCN